MAMVSEKSRGLRIRQGVLLLIGALVLELLVAGGTLSFFWTPLILGLTYLAAAGAGGRDGSYWATACVLTGWGLAVILISELSPAEIDTSGAYMLGAGLGAVVGVRLGRAGFAVSELGLVATVAAAGLILALTPRFQDVLADARTYAVLIGLIALVNLAIAAAASRAAKAAE